MTELQLSSSLAPKPDGSHAFKMVKWLLVAIGVMAAIVAVLGLHEWGRYAERFKEIDHSADSITISTPKPARPEGSPDAGYRVVAETIYRNTKSGVTLKLPGVWRGVSAPQITQPDPAHRFCILDSQDGLDAMFWPIFPDLLPSLEADADFLRTRFTRGGFVLKGEKDLEIHGRKAKQFFLSSTILNMNLNLIVIRKWPVVYALAITGPPQAQSAWKRVDEALPESVDIQ